MFWWRIDPTRPPPIGNFGDEISALVVEKIFGYKPTWASPDSCELAAAGSIIDYILATKGRNIPKIWGSGFMHKQEASHASDDVLQSDTRLHVSAVRGAHTLALLSKFNHQVPLGDPGLLADALLDSKPRKKYTLGVIPHIVDAGLPEVDWLRSQSGVVIINAINDPRTVIETMAKCHYIVSSSLHGLITADALGVPNVHLRLSCSPWIGGSFKFGDYYSVFEAANRHIVLDSQQLTEGSISTITKYIESRFVPPRDIDQIKDRLIRAFPA